MDKQQAKKEKLKHKSTSPEDRLRAEWKARTQHRGPEFDISKVRLDLCRKYSIPVKKLKAILAGEDKLDA